MPNATASALKKASQGMFYMSEKDAPYSVFSWDGKAKLTKKRVLELIKQPATSPVEEITLDELFAGMTQEQSWHGKDEKAAVAKNQQLLQAIKDNLTQPRVFKVGRVKVGVYIVGKDAAGNWTGLATEALET